MWNKDDWVVVISGTFCKSKDFKDVSFSICQIIETGADDLLVRPQNSLQWNKRAFFVPKSRCKYIPVDIPDIYEDVRKPQIGDLVYYYRHDYSGKLYTCVSHVLELKHGTNDSPEAMITFDNKHIWVSIETLLVLDVNKSG